MADTSTKTNKANPANTAPGQSSKPMSSGSGPKTTSQAISSATGQKAKLPPIEPSLKNQFAQVDPGSTSASNQGDNSPTQEPGKKSLVKLAAVLVPIVLLLLILAAVYFFFIKKKQPSEPVAQASPPIAVSSPVPNATPPTLPKVEDPQQANSLKDYFSKVSPNFKEEFMNLVPKAAGDAYNSFVSAQGDAKLEAARAFYIYLNNPAIDRNNAQLVAFVGDVKADLEKTVGKPLF